MIYKKQGDPFSVELMVPCKYNVMYKASANAEFDERTGDDNGWMEANELNE